MAELYKRRRRSDNNKDLESRVSSVETAVEHIEVSMVDIKDSIKDGFSDVERKIDAQESANKPQIVAWAGWAAVLLLVIGMFGSGYIRDLNRVEIKLEQISQDLTKDNIKLNIDNASQNTKLDFITQEIKRLETRK